MTDVPRRSRDRRLVWILSGALTLAVLLLIAALVRPDTAGTSAQPSSSPSGQPAAEGAAGERRLPDLSRRIADDPTAKGAVDAPVVLVEFADYRCPFCGVYARETLPKLIDEYVAKGQLRIEWRDMPIFGEQSVNAAVAARAAGAQGKFWEYSAAVFAYPGNDHQDLPRERLVELAGQAGVPDIAAFEAALTDPELAKAVNADQAEARRLGVSSTPTFAVGGVPLMGAQPIEAFRAAIDAELARAGR